jgi:hypothetical protein
LADGLSLPPAAVLALGVYPIVSCADARAARDAAKKLLARDVDPSQARKEQKRATRLSAENTFEIVAREWCENQKDGWTGRYHDHVVTRLEADVFPELGSRPIAYENIRCVQSATSDAYNLPSQGDTMSADGARN